MLDGLMGKMQEAQQKMEEAKLKLNDIILTEQSSRSEVIIKITANKEIKDISLNENFLKDVDKEELEDLLINTVNSAIKQAEQKSEIEMQSIAGTMLPPGMGF